MLVLALSPIAWGHCSRILLYKDATVNLTTLHPYKAPISAVFECLFLPRLHNLAACLHNTDICRSL